MKTILLLDDDAHFRKAVGTTLQQQGYRVVAAANGTDGLTLALGQPPDLVLSDVDMSGGGGFELLQQLRAHSETAGIPVILMTGQPETRDARFSMAQGADDYLAKPFAMEDMVAAISTRLKRQTAIQQAALASQEAKLLSTEEKLRLQTSALEATANAIQITSRTGIILWINPAFTALTGYSAEEAVGQNTSMLKSGQHPPSFYTNLWATISAGNVWHGEMVNQRKDGSFYHEEMTITPVRDTHGEIQNFIAIKQDVSARYKIEQALAGERDLLQSLMDNLPDHIYFKDTNSRFTRINLALARYLGLRKPEEAIGKSDADFFPVHEARQKLVDESRLLLTGEPLLGMIERSETPAETMWVSSTKVAVRGKNGEITGLVGISRDITPAKEAEEELQRKTAFLEGQVNSSIDGILVVDEDGRKVLQNRRMIDMFKIPQTIADDEDDRKLLEWFKQSAKNPEQFLGRVRNLYAHPTETSRDEIELVDGRILDRYSAPILGKTGKYYGRMWTFRDITARKRNEEELRWKTAFLEAQVNSSNDGVFVVDQGGTKILQNQRMTDLFQIPRHLAEDKCARTQRQWLADMTTDPGQILNKIDYLYSQPHEISRDELELKDGTVLDLYSSPVIGTAGEYYGRIWTFHDITKRKRAVESLCESEERFRQLADNISDVFWMTSPDFKTILYVSEGYQRIWGRSTGSWYSNPEQWRETILPEDRERVAATFADLKENGPEVSVEYRIARPDGSIRWVHDRGFRVRNAAGGLLRLAGIASDVTERKGAEAALRDSEEKYRGLFENSLDAIVMVDPTTGRFISGNPAAMKMFGAQSEEQLASYGPADLSPERQPDGSNSAERAAKIHETVRREHSHCFEWTHRRVNGEEFSANVLLAQMVRGGKPVVMATIRDSTERKVLEAQLFQAQKLESIGQLAAGIAHEINTPTQYVGDNTRFVKDSFEAIGKVLQCHEELLAAARQNAIGPELLARNEAVLAESDLDYLREQIPSALKETLEGVERVSKIIRAMKEFSHPGGKDKTPADLNKAIESTATVARNEWKYVAELKLELDPDLPFIPCFIGEFNQAILNLIVNAAHAIGDVVKNNPGTKGLITVKTRRDGDWVEIRVTDTGTGIPEFARPKIFAQFFTTKEVGKGTGQGLAMIYGSIVKRHSGTVTFETAMGKGTTFIIRLPLKPKPISETQVP